MKQYLGDGVYINFDGHDITLTTENGIEVQNRIVLEPKVLHSLFMYLNRLRRGESNENTRVDPSPEEGADF